MLISHFVQRVWWCPCFVIVILVKDIYTLPFLGDAFGRAVTQIPLSETTRVGDLNVMSLIRPPWKPCPAGQETAQVPVKDRGSPIPITDLTARESFVPMCTDPYGVSCEFPGSYVSFNESCSLQCQCIKTTASKDYRYTSCRSICTTPPKGLRCFSQAEPGGCCPTYTDCVNVVPANFKGEWSGDQRSYNSSKFRCMPGEILDSPSCLMLIKEAIPQQVFTPWFRGTCSCVSVNTFKISLFNSKNRSRGSLGASPKLTLIRSSGKIGMERL